MSSKLDIALIMMDKPVVFTDFIQPICLPSPEQQVNYIKGTIVGHGLVEIFGDEKADLPKEGLLTIRSNKECKRIIKNYDYSSSTLCGGATGDCMGTGE